MAQKREYTMRIHMLRVRRALREFPSGGFCPAAPNFDWNRDPEEQWKNNPCGVCQGFVNATDCPCVYFGDEGARKKTIRNLHLAGYQI